MIPPRIILAAVDFSAPSRTALEFAARFARHTAATLHVVYVEEPLLAEAARQSGVDLAKDTQEELRRFVAAAGAESLSPQLHALTGPTTDRILEVAREQRADLVVLGSHGMSGAERTIFGSVTERVLRRAGVSVLVTPPQWSNGRSTAMGMSGIGPVIAGVAFTPASTAAATAACQLATVFGTRVEMVHVVESLPVLERWRSHAEAVIRNRTEAAQSALEDVVRDIGCRVPVDAHVATGNIAEQLAEAAGTGNRRPLLVLGRRSPDQGTPGAIAYRVLTLARVPVLMYVQS